MRVYTPGGVFFHKQKNTCALEIRKRTFGESEVGLENRDGKLFTFLAATVVPDRRGVCTAGGVLVDPLAQRVLKIVFVVVVSCGAGESRDSSTALRRRRHRHRCRGGSRGGGGLGEDSAEASAARASSADSLSAERGIYETSFGLESAKNRCRGQRGRRRCCLIFTNLLAV